MKTRINGIRVIALFVIAATMAVSANAQPGRGNKQPQREKIEAQRVAFITDKMNLTPAEAQAFWPVYNEYDAKRHELAKSFRESGDKENKGIEQLSDKEATEMADNQLIEAQKQLDLRKEYHARFKSILPPKKVLLLYQSEREFQKHLLDRLREGHKPGEGNAQHPGNRQDKPVK